MGLHNRCLGRRVVRKPFPRSLADRSLRGVKLMVVDDEGSVGRRCQVIFHHVAALPGALDVTSLVVTG